MSPADIVLSLLIIFLFVMMSTFTLVVGELQKMKRNWAEYRCHPSVMPFASFFGTDPVSNFTYCLSNQQTVASPYLSAGRDAVQSGIVDVVGQMGNAASSTASFGSSLRLNTGMGMTNIFGMMGNATGVGQTVAGMASAAKMAGTGGGQVISKILSTGGAMLNAIWEGPPGKMVRDLGDL